MSEEKQSASSKKGYSDKDFFKASIKTKMVKHLLDKSGISQSEIASYLDCSVQSFRNKMNRNSFSLYDFIVICHVCNADFTINIGNNNEPTFNLIPSEMLTETENERIKQITMSRADKNTKDLQKIMESLSDDEKAKVLEQLK